MPQQILVIGGTGRPVHLILSVRRFRCQKRTGERKIFAEQFPDTSHF